ncbi:MAG: alpha/beta hydrolase [Planctomycetota bacterium]|nr:alpha/beta hydrolase [Planctomycetota bacterium]
MRAAIGRAFKSAIIISALAALSGHAAARQAATTPATPAQPSPAASSPATTSAIEHPRGPGLDRPLAPLAHVEVRGKGPVPMILVPGIACDWTVWESFMQRNDARYRMYAVTLPGVGESDPPELREDESWDSMILTLNAERVLARLVSDLALDRPVIVGHGYGGQLAMRLALDYPTKFRAAVSIDGMTRMPGPDPRVRSSLESRKQTITQRILPNTLEVDDETFKSLQFKATLSLVTDDHRARDLALMFNRTDRGMITFYSCESALIDISDRMSGMKVPLLCVAPVSPDQPRWRSEAVWAATLAGSASTTLVYIEPSRSFVMDDQPDALDGFIDLFVRGENIPGSVRSADIRPVAPPVPIPTQP